jgi:hypothetical protein
LHTSHSKLRSQHGEAADAKTDFPAGDDDRDVQAQWAMNEDTLAWRAQA